MELENELGWKPNEKRLGFNSRWSVGLCVAHVDLGMYVRNTLIDISCRIVMNDHTAARSAPRHLNAMNT